MRKILLLAAALAFALGAFLTSCAAQAKPPGRAAQTCPYTVSLKMLPAESFTRGHSARAWDARA